MKDEHIVDVLDQGPLAVLSEAERERVLRHVAVCEPCLQAFEAAQLSAVLIRERVAQAVEPSPFFHTRVMAAWREQQAGNSAPVLQRLWKAAGVLVSSMAATTAALAVLSFFGPGSPQETTSSNPYSAESVILAGNSNEDQLSYEEVLNAIYAEEEEAR